MRLPCEIPRRFRLDFLRRIIAWHRQDCLFIGKRPAIQCGSWQMVFATEQGTAFEMLIKTKPEILGRGSLRRKSGAGIPTRFLTGTYCADRQGFLPGGKSSAYCVQKMKAKKNHPVNFLLTGWFSCIRKGADLLDHCRNTARDANSIDSVSKNSGIAEKAHTCRLFGEESYSLKIISLNALSSFFCCAAASSYLGAAVV